MRLTTSPPLYVKCHEIWESKPPGALWATPGLLRDSFTFYDFQLSDSGMERVIVWRTERTRKRKPVGGEGWNVMQHIWKETGNVSDQMPLRTVTNKVSERNRRHCNVLMVRADMDL
jgi:hypothetical protein